MMNHPDFNATTPVLDFGATHGDMRYERSTRVRFAWPVYACDIVCTMKKEAPLNIFQEHVLRVLHARASRPEEIARVLCLEIGIIDKVLSELKSMDWIDKHLTLTDTAREYLTTEEETTSLSGTVFLDASSKERFVHPIFVPRGLRSKRVEVSEAKSQSKSIKHFKIKTGTAGKPIETHIEVPRTSEGPFEPRAAQIIDALAQSARHTARCKELGIDYRLDLVTGVVRDVSIIATELRSHYLYTYAFVPEGESYWLVCDPFGRGASLAYRRLAQQSPALKDICKKSLMNARQHIPLSDVHSLHHKALEKLCDMLAGESDEFDAREVMSRLAEHIELADRIGAWSARMEGVTEAWPCLELLYAHSITEVSSEARIDAVMQGLPKSPTSSGSVICSQAEQLGFTVSDSTRSWLDQITRSRIKGVLKDDGASMNAASSAAILMHGKESDSSWHQLALLHPDLLDRLCALNELRKQEVHEDSQMRDTSRHKEMVRLVLDCIHVLVLKQCPSRQGEIHVAVHDEIERMQRQRQARLYAISYLEDHEALDASARLYLEHLLTQLRASSMMCSEQDDREHVYAARVILHSYILAEYCMGRISDVCARRTSELLDVDKETNVRRLHTLHEELGGKGSVEKFGLANPQMVTRQLRHLRPKGLSPRVWKSLLDAQKDPAHPLRSILKQEPKFLAHINDISDLRGHGDRAIARGDIAHRVALQITHILTLTLTTLSQDDAPS